jgi:hypothetical protein
MLVLPIPSENFARRGKKMCEFFSLPKQPLMARI